MMSDDVVFILGLLIGLVIGTITGAFIISALCVSKNSELQDRIDKVINFICNEYMPQRPTTKEEKIILDILKGENNE